MSIMVIAFVLIIRTLYVYLVAIVAVAVASVAAKEADLA